MGARVCLSLFSLVGTDPWDDEDGAWVTSPAVAPAPVAAPSNGEKTTNPSAEAAGWGEDEGGCSFV